METLTIQSLIQLSKKVGIPIQVISEKDSNIIVDKKSILLYNVDREIYGSFLLNQDIYSNKQAIFGPLLMAEVSFGIDEALEVIDDFREVLHNFYILLHHTIPENIEDSKLDIKSYYQDTKFIYNTFDNIDDFYRLELLLFSHIKDYNQLAAFKTIDLFFKYFYYRLTSDQLKCFYCSIITLLTRVQIEKGAPVKKIFDQQFLYYRYFSEIKNIQTFNYLIKKAISDFLGQTIKISIDSYSPLVIHVLNNIENHLYENITLSDICLQLGRDPKYVGRLFFKELGMHFKEYIHTKKIEKAKYLLLFTDKTINDISEELSFSSQSHFSTLFKNLVGITPYQYQKQRIYYSF